MVTALRRKIKQGEANQERLSTDLRKWWGRRAHTEKGVNGWQERAWRVRETAWPPKSEQGGTEVRE